ncbi:myelin basic -like protein [Labeo rohita]|uniref:Myelin basic-like protein n=1 Tax=Labeo rohita TaxID=84645 RepID=A0A498LE54_LABRO|nr:myelin basic -like protein [Labeo rohita]RXN22950.1 myelin basic -like protein [Labeo rohita]
MASASSSQSTFRLGRSKKNPTVMDQIGKFFGGDKKKKGKVSPSTPKSRRDQKSQSSTKGQKGRGDTLTRIFKMGGSQSASSTKR